MCRAGTRRAVLVTVCGVLLCAGCASIPDHGPVHTVDSDTQAHEEPYFLHPSGPVPGSTQEQIADDFMGAMRAQPISAEIAREFLTKSAAKKWDPGKETIVHSGYSVDTASDHHVHLTLETMATLGRRGSYTPRDGSRTLDLTMRKENGQWRIDRLPDAFLVSQTTFEANYRPLSLYFVDPSRRFVVPEPVYLPGGDQLATNAVNGLLRGPTDALDKVTNTFLPDDVSLDVSVRVRDDGLAQVRLAGSLGDLPAQSRELLSAQIVLTLRQIPGVESVQILVNGTPFDAPGVGEQQDVDTWNRYDTSVASERTPLFAVRDDHLVEVEDGQLRTIGESGGGRIDDFGIDASEQRVAVIDEGRTEAAVGPIAAAADDRRTVLAGKQLLAPRWDVRGWLWLTDAREESTSVAVWRDQQLRSIPVGALAGMRVRGISISPDGTRFAAIATKVGSKHPDRDAAVYVGLIRRSGDDGAPVEVLGVHAVPLEGSGLHSARSVAWRDASNLVVLAEQGSLNAQPYIVAIDGSSVSGGVDVGQPSLPDIGANSVAASGRITDPIYVADDDGQVWQLDSNQRWSSISDAKIWTPHFAG